MSTVAEYAVVACIVLACALYWGMRLFPRAARITRTRLGLAPKAQPAGHSACGSCRACSGGGCH